MTKYVAISLVAILLAACNSSKNPHSSSGQEEDLSAKELLQGIWLDDETESPLMRSRRGYHLLCGFSECSYYIQNHTGYSLYLWQ